MSNEKPFIFRKPGESQDEAGERISKEFDEGADSDQSPEEPDSAPKPAESDQ
ncbi:MAG: hypothetical protein ACP5H2_12595 [Solirubrobacteraceae bacterium]